MSLNIFKIKLSYFLSKYNANKRHMIWNQPESFTFELLLAAENHSKYMIVNSKEIFFLLPLQGRPMR
jgi:hypothetical protein